MIDDRSEPDFPGLYRQLTLHSATLDVAATRIRLTGLRLEPHELEKPTRIRVLLMEMNALQLRTELDFLSVEPGGEDRIRGLADLLRDQRLLVRCLPLGGWSPDFSVFQLKEGGSCALVGPHWMERPYPQRGPGLASLHTGPSASLAAGRFRELWAEAHDVGQALEGVFARRNEWRRG